ncbi:MAG: NAD-dependent epimerase/dehydratase family protein [Opitutales bacterium]|jgi:nucleoside-diphosphate-sugar epimerase
MKILVTGGGGFLGGYVVSDLLAEGHSVIAYQRSASPQLESRGGRVVRGNLSDGKTLRAALEGCDAVIHIAAKAGVWGAAKDFLEVNLTGTETLLEAMESASVRKLVYCSSPSVVLNGEQLEGADESLPYGKNWLTTYPMTKAMAEQRVLKWGLEGKGAVIALRPHLIWGKGDPHLFPTIIERARQGRLRVIGDGRNRIDHTRVENVSAAHLLALHALDRPTAVNRAYFISQGDVPLLWDWINSMLERVHVPVLEKRIPFSLAYAAGACFEVLWRLLGRESIPPMTRFVAVAMAKSHWFSIEAARNELGYNPENFPTEEGMDAYAKAWLAGDTPTRGR